MVKEIEQDLQHLKMCKILYKLEFLNILYKLEFVTDNTHFYFIFVGRYISYEINDIVHNYAQFSGTRFFSRATFKTTG